MIARRVPRAHLAVLNTCAVPLRRRMVHGELGWCAHRWWLVAREDGSYAAECDSCGHSISVPNWFLEGNQQGRVKESLSAPNITGTGT